MGLKQEGWAGLRVLIAPDSFKGTLTAVEAASAIARGWASVRPDDELELVPLADGGEGTLDAIEAVTVGAVRRRGGLVTGPDGRPLQGEWLVLPGGIAVVELAGVAGLPFMPELAPLSATTRGVGELMYLAVAEGAQEVWLALGGSASTDAGLGALRALGVVARDAVGENVAEGASGLQAVASLDFSGLLPITGGVTLLTDVVAPLVGPHGAAVVFGPQKGATPQQVEIMDCALGDFAALAGGDPHVPGAGAAGGAGFGFMAAYGAKIRSGADRIAELAGLDQRLDWADVVITGEGSFDEQSTTGKLVGNVLQRAAAAGIHGVVIAGRVGTDADVWAVGLDQLAGGSQQAMDEAAHWAVAAGKHAAEEWGVQLMKLKYPSRQARVAT